MTLYCLLIKIYKESLYTIKYKFYSIHLFIGGLKVLCISFQFHHFNTVLNQAVIH